MKKTGKGRLFVVSAPSGAGKTTVVRKAIKKIRDIKMSVSWTTRKPRKGERGGVDYAFKTNGEFESLLKKGGFLEHARVFGHDYYGTPRSNIEDAKKGGFDLFLVIDVQGAAQIRKKVKGSVQIFILPPGMEALEERLRKRGVDSGTEMKRRLATAAREIKHASKYDFIIVNDKLPRAVARLVEIIKVSRKN